MTEDDGIEVNDFVIVSAGKDNHEAIVKVVNIEYFNDDRLKELGGGGYFKELLERIRDIRASEKVFYRQVLEIYATSVNYNPKAEVSIQFFKRVQKKFTMLFPAKLPLR